MNWRRLLLIYNTEAGRTQLAAKLDGLFKQLYGMGFALTVCPVGADRDAQALLREEGEKYDAAVCIGGDGTLHHTLNALLSLEKPPLLGYLPAGSTNDFAASLGLSGDLDEGCRRIARWQPRALDAGLFGGEAFCYVAAFGIFTKVSYSAPREMKNLLGHFAYVLEGVRTLDLFSSWRARVEVNGEVLEGDFWYGSVSNATSVGGFAFPAANAVQLDDGKFEVLLVKKPANAAELADLALRLAKQDFTGPHLRLFHAERARFQFEKPVAWTLDGEFGGEVQCADVRVQPGAVRLLS